jgi:hypothetical protein
MAAAAEAGEADNLSPPTTLNKICQNGEFGGLHQTRILWIRSPAVDSPNQGRRALNLFFVSCFGQRLDRVHRRAGWMMFVPLYDFMAPQ